MQGTIEAASDVDIRIALPTVADGNDDRKKDPLAVLPGPTTLRRPAELGAPLGAMGLTFVWTAASASRPGWT